MQNIVKHVSGRKMCQHCRKAVASRPYQLCWHHFYQPEIRKKYKVTKGYGNRGIGLGNAIPPMPAHATRHLPGSPEKFHVILARSEAGEQLWHPDDAANTDDSPGIPGNLYSFPLLPGGR